MRRELPKSAWSGGGERGGEGGASAPRPNFCFGPRTLILKKNTWNFLLFFFKPANFFMNAAPNNDEESDDNDFSLEIDDEEDNEDDDTAFDFSHPAQVSFCACDCQLPS
jgi:hypothetical protein